MRVHEVMTAGVEITRPGATLQEAALQMRRHMIGMLPVCENGKLIGIVTDRDITVRATAEGRPADLTPVAAVMTPSVTTCYEDQLVIDAALLMQGNQVRRLIVVDRLERPVGVLSLSDLATVAHDEQLTEMILEEVADKGG